MRFALLILPFCLLLTPVCGVAQARALNSHEIMRELGVRPESRQARARFLDHAYVYPDHEWLTQVYLPYFRETVLAWQQHQPRPPSATLLATLFKTQLGVSNAHGGGARQGEVACAILRRRSDVDRAEVLIRTDRGWFALDPAGGEPEPWASFAGAGDLRTIEF